MFGFSDDVAYSPIKSRDKGLFSYFRPKSSITKSRLVDRDRSFHQSMGTVSIHRKIRRRNWRALYSRDWFHSLVNAPTGRIFLLLSSVYMLLTLVFAVIYMKISLMYPYCNLDIKNFTEAFAFSLETMATIGYSTKDIFFGDCILAIAVITIQICVKIVTDALIIGVIYCRFARPHSRACTIIFSDKAVIRRIRGKLYFMFQLCELRKHQLTEAHIRLYLVRRDVDLYLNNYGANGEGDHNICSPYATRRSAHCSQGQGGVDNDDNSSCAETPFAHLKEAGNNNNSAAKRGNQWSQEEECCSDEEGNEDGDLVYSPMTADGSYQNSQSMNQQQQQQHQQQQQRKLPQAHFQTCTMRLSHPNDELSGMLLMCLPQVIVHHIDCWSPLMPPPVWLARETGYLHRWHPPTYAHARKKNSVSIPSTSSKSSLQQRSPQSSNNAVLRNLEPDDVKKRIDFSTATGVELTETSTRQRITSNGKSGDGKKFDQNLQPLKPPSVSTRRIRSNGEIRYNPDMLDNIDFPAVSQRSVSVLSNYDDSHCHEIIDVDDDDDGYNSNSNSNGNGGSHSTYYDRSPGLREFLAIQEGNFDPRRHQSMNGSQQTKNDFLKKETAEQRNERMMLELFMSDRSMEIIAVLEGTDSSTGGSVQARHSYTHNDVEWNKSFRPCVFEDESDASAVIDFGLFHDLIDVEVDAPYAGCLPSHI